MSSNGFRKKTGSGKGPDLLFGYLIPLFFMSLAAYQEITKGTVDKYVVGALFLFGLAALGYRIDVLLERYLIARSGGSQKSLEKSNSPPEGREGE